MLPSLHRLPKTEISNIMRYGSPIADNELLLKYKKTTGIPRFAFVVSTKIDKRATQRNRIRRILSESVRNLLPTIPPIDAVFIVRKNIAERLQIDEEKMITEFFSKIR